MDMSIVAMSVGMHDMQAQQELGVSVLKMAMQDGTQGAEQLLEEMAPDVDPNLGQNIDIMA